MDRVMTMSEINAQFDSEWVLIEEPVTNDRLEVLSGKVRHHSKDRDEVYRAAIALNAKRIAVFFIGKMPENTAIVL